MPLTDDEKRNLEQLRERRSSASNERVERLNSIINEVDLTGISPDDLRALCNPDFVVGVDFRAIDTSSNFTTADMNRIAPGAIDVKALRAKISPRSLIQAQTSEIVDTQSGVVVVTNTVKANVGIEDLMASKVKSQGTNMQLVNRSDAINRQSVENKEIKSKFVR